MGQMNEEVEVTSSGRVLYFDLLNIAACICVVAMHCNGIVHTYSDARCWKTSLIVETVAFWAVPVFFMLTGATLVEYRKRYSTKEFFVKRIKKTVIPFVIWSIIFLLLQLYFGNIVSQELSVSKVLQMIFNSEIVPVYWFFPPLFTVYLALPVISIIPEKYRQKIFNYVIVYGLCFICVLPILLPLIGISFNGHFTPAICGGYLIYVLLGYQLSKTELSCTLRVVIYISGIGGWLLRFLTTLIISPKIGELFKVFWNDRGFSTIALAVAVFVWFQYHNWGRLAESERFRKWIKMISSASFGIYLIHWLFVWKLPGYLRISTSSWEWRTIGILVVYMLSFLCVMIMKKIPLVKKVVP